MISMGCDVGTIMTKTVILRNASLVACDITPNDGRIEDAIEHSVNNALDKAEITLSALESISGTGFGEKYIPFPHQMRNMISCLAKGVHHVAPSARTVVDIGGLSSTCIHVDSMGKPIEYRMSDRCASGTGFFIDLAVQALELKLDGLNEVTKSASNKVHISSQCAVFGESEIVSHVNCGVSAAEIIAGIGFSIGSMVSTIIRRLGVVPDIIATGGLAKMDSVVNAMNEVLGTDIKRTELDPQLIAAIGAALIK